ncbi:hypothetical protein BA894_19570 [Vibrio natriegens]|uniref:OmpA family protein n=1 Tax=Vibrio natriegens TaxID=691 RepID=UPI0008042731|nr:OmpA family protein [Vibrio natriegens]ANQ28614.1 hypothetical protein BA894_19570 [Vibrio natriegens]
MNTIKKIFLLTTAATLLACTSKGNQLVGEETFSSQRVSSESELTSEVVFYNAGLQDDNSEAMVIFSNGSVMAGLQPSQYVVLPVCKGSQLFQVTHSGLGGAVNLQVAADSVQYVKLIPNSSPSGIRYEQSSISSISDALKDSSSKSFLVPRHNLNCEVDKPTEFNLSSESFFEFGGAQLMDVVKSDDLKNVIDFIHTHEDKGLKVTVSGYTDYIGDRDFNQSLSEARAQTVADYIVSRGFDGPIHAFGFGPSEPVVTCSSALERNDLIRCLQPNRRVTVRIWQTN